MVWSGFLHARWDNYMPLPFFIRPSVSGEKWSHRVGPVVPLFSWEVEHVHDPTG
jgi:hypothetical protein